MKERIRDTYIRSTTLYFTKFLVVQQINKKNSVLRQIATFTLEYLHNHKGYTNLGSRF